MRKPALLIGGLFTAMLLPALEAQRGTAPNPGDWPLAISNILPSGQPVIPIFESWIPNPDGSIQFSFGYINLNSEETHHIPLGPDNFIEPRQYDGFQPTYFEVAPKPRTRFGRHQSVFIVTVPKGFKGDVTWTLRVRGKNYSSPARTTREEYGIEDLESLTEAPVAPMFKFAPANLSGRGRQAFVAGPLKATVGQPLPLSVGIDLLSRPSSIVTWYQHQGPGTVTFNPKEVVVKAAGDVKTSATFSEPGDFVLRVTGIESLASLEQHCCYTNGYIRVTATR